MVLSSISETPALATEAAKKVKVTYKEVSPPVLTLWESLAKDMEFKDARVNKVIGSPDGEVVQTEIINTDHHHFWQITLINTVLPFWHRSFLLVLR